MSDLQLHVKQASSLAAAKLLSHPWEDHAHYIGWLSQTYHYVRHSTRLLAAAAARFPLTELGEQFHVRFGRHIGEERAHEKLALHDLKMLGASPPWAELPTTRMFYETQYHKVSQNPYQLMGYILFLEATGPLCGSSILERVEAEYGDKCCSFLRLHTEEDVAHVQIALQQCLTLDPQSLELVVQNLHQSSAAYCVMLEELQTIYDAVRSFRKS